MIKSLQYKYYASLAAITVGLLSSDANAQLMYEKPANNFSTISRNISDSIEELPGLVTSISYLFGILLGVLGVLKIKDHVENPTQTPLKEGSIRLATGGALFALPIIFESMLNTIGTSGISVGSPEVSKAQFNVR